MLHTLERVVDRMLGPGMSGWEEYFVNFSNGGSNTPAKLFYSETDTSGILNHWRGKKESHIECTINKITYTNIDSDNAKTFINKVREFSIGDNLLTITVQPSSDNVVLTVGATSLTMKRK